MNIQRKHLKRSVDYEVSLLREDEPDGVDIINEIFDLSNLIKKTVLIVVHQLFILQRKWRGLSWQDLDILLIEV